MVRQSQRILGVDFDNTIASYGDVLHRLALEWGLISEEVKKDKGDIREQVRLLPGGEIEWQRLQGAVYGPQIHSAKLIDGVQSFFETCKQHGSQVYIVSHKTEYAGYDETRTNLRTAAMDWMNSHRFFQAEEIGLRSADVYFEATHRKKLQRFDELGCTHVIDDLEETFLEDLLPEDVVKILYAPNGTAVSLAGVRIARTWAEITDQVFNVAG